MPGNDEQQDNDALDEKLSWRREALRHVNGDIVPFEAYGGWGVIGRELYSAMRGGLVMEKESPKAALLGQLRPSWAVYEGDTLKMLRVGAGRHLLINYIDCDPYGEPWTTLHAFFESDRQLHDHMVIVAHDGIHRLVQMGRAWSVEVLEPIVKEHGNSFVKDMYGVASMLLLDHIVSPLGYTVSDFRWAPGGDRKKSAHWFGIVSR